MKLCSPFFLLASFFSFLLDGNFVNHLDKKKVKRWMEPTAVKILRDTLMVPVKERFFRDTMQNA